MKDYSCKIASIDEMEIKWNYEIGKHKNSNWIIWKSEATAMLDKTAVQNSDGLVDDKTAYLCAFRTIKKYQGKGYFSKLFRFMIDDLKSKGYKKVTLGVEPNETENLKIYKHLGFKEFLKSARETYPDGTVVDVDYYGMKLN